MLKIFLDQKTIRRIFIPANTITLFAMLITTCVPFDKIPKASFSFFVFWLFKPMLLTEIVLTTVVLLLGFTGSTKYNRCWQTSFTFFLFLLCIIGAFSVLFVNNIRSSVDTVIVKLNEKNQFQDYIAQVYQDLDCSSWNDTENSIGCHTKIINTLGDYPEWAKPFVIASLVILVFYALLNLFASMFVHLKEESVNRIERD